MKRLLVHFVFLLPATIIPLVVVVGQTCPSDQITPTDMLGPFYVAETPITTVIGPSDLLQDPSSRLDVSGRVLRAPDCTKGLANVTIEVWYAGSVLLPAYLIYQLIVVRAARCYAGRKGRLNIGHWCTRMRTDNWA